MSTPEDPYPWLPIAAVADHLGVKAPGEGGSYPAEVERARQASAAYCERQRRDLAEAFAAGEVGPDVVEAGVLGAARIYARKGSPAGIASYAEFGAAGILSYDPDVERLLGIGRYGAPEVG